MLLVQVKTDDIYKDIAQDVETTPGTSNYDIYRSLLKRKKKKVIGLKKDELLGKIMKKKIGLRAKIYSIFIDKGSEDKNAKDTKSVS